MPDGRESARRSHFIKSGKVVERLLVSFFFLLDDPFV